MLLSPTTRQGSQMLLRFAPLVIAVAMALGSCANPSQTVIDAALGGDPETIARAILEDQLSRKGIATDIEDVEDLIEAATRLIATIWGEREAEVASEHRYVKYSNRYEARAIVDFDEGWLQVETIASEEPESKLRQAIIDTLLTTQDMSVEDIFTDAQPPTGGEPFLLGQVLDRDSQAIRWPWRAERFADYLIGEKLQKKSYNGKTLRSVRVALVADHLHLRELEYADFVLTASRRYGVKPSLIYAVIEVESAFNPYAVSPAKAYGLMQVVPSSAGRDVFERVKKRAGQPTKQELFNPDFNIDIGSAYLHLLDDTYLFGITDSESRLFTAIAAYNGGASSALRTFDPDANKALRRINALSSSQVYQRLTKDHPFAETRRYLEKVRAAQSKYR